MPIDQSCIIFIMTRALQVNAHTKFLESVNPVKQSFDSDKKIQFLKLATNHINEKNEMPDLLSLCNAVGINVRTLYIHINLDPVFSECWKEIKCKIDSLLTNDLYIKSKSKMGTLALLALLRHNESGKWNQDQITINHSSDSAQVKTILSSVNDYIEADIIPESKQLDASKSANNNRSSK